MVLINTQIRIWIIESLAIIGYCNLQMFFWKIRQIEYCTYLYDLNRAIFREIKAKKNYIIIYSTYKSISGCLIQCLRFIIIIHRILADNSLVYFWKIEFQLTKKSNSLFNLAIGNFPVKLRQKGLWHQLCMHALHSIWISIT